MGIEFENFIVVEFFICMCLNVCVFVYFGDEVYRGCVDEDVFGVVGDGWKF